MYFSGCQRSIKRQTQKWDPQFSILQNSGKGKLTSNEKADIPSLWLMMPLMELIIIMVIDLAKIY